jgi:hypothetical protein
MLRRTLVEVREVAKSSSRTQTISASKNRLDSRLRHGYELFFKPGMALEPWLIARRRMWQRNVLWSVLPPGLGRFGQRRLAAVGQQMIEPQRSVLTARRHITAVSSAWIIIAHGNDGDSRLIIKTPLSTPIQSRRRSRLGSPDGMPVECTRTLGAYPTTRMRATTPARSTGRGPSGRCASHARQSRTAVSNVSSVR